MVQANRLWETEPRRRTCLATVTAVSGDAFTLDSCLFRPRTRAYRHGQRADQGTVWIRGEKRRLTTVYEQKAQVWHRLRGTVPQVGDQLNCHLDAQRRDEDSRAHTALHLMLAALQRQAGARLAADPEVKGGGKFRIDLAEAFVAPKVLAGALAQVNAWVDANHAVHRFHVARDEAIHHLDPQPFADEPYPGPPTSLSAVEIEGVCRYPCDGTHAARTQDVGRVVLRVAKPGKLGFTLVGEVPRQP